jgi:hypothetical protein
VTNPEMLNKRDLKGRLIPGHGPANTLLESEHDGLIRNIKAVESSFGSDMLCLAVSLKYLERIARNPGIRKYVEASSPKRLPSFWDS